MEITKEQSKRFLDKKILETIDEELETLEQLTDVKEYKKQIGNRRTGITMFFKDYEKNRELIQEKNWYRIKGKITKADNYTKALDKIMQDKIETRMGKISTNALKSRDGREGRLNEEITQIVDRQLGVIELLENYDENIRFLSERSRVFGGECLE